jgi:hypothetical protein
MRWLKPCLRIENVIIVNQIDSDAFAASDHYTRDPPGPFHILVQFGQVRGRAPYLSESGCRLSTLDVVDINSRLQADPFHGMIRLYLRSTGAAVRNGLSSPQIRNRLAVVIRHGLTSGARAYRKYGCIS